MEKLVEISLYIGGVRDGHNVACATRYYVIVSQTSKNITRRRIFRAIILISFLILIHDRWFSQKSPAYRRSSSGIDRNTAGEK